MMDQPHFRKSIRLPEYDYSSPGGYFITIVTQNRVCHFGEIKNGVFIPNSTAAMIEYWWNKMSNKFSPIIVDEYCLMPNHIHGIITILDNGDINKDENIPISLPKITQWFKTMTTNYYIKNVKESNWKPFYKKLWQRNYYEHIIRNEEELNMIRRYIIDNPIKWEMDRENPESI